MKVPNVRIEEERQRERRFCLCGGRGEVEDMVSFRVRGSGMKGLVLI